MRYRVVYHLLHLALFLAWGWVLMQVAGTDHPGWKMVLPTLVVMFFPKEWLAEKISGQPRRDPFGRSERKEPESRPSMDERRPAMDRLK